MESKIRKYLEGKASHSEMLSLIPWLEKKENHNEFKRIKSEWKARLNEQKLSPDTLLELDKFKSKILSDRNREIRKLNLTQRFYKYAAILLLLITVGGTSLYISGKSGSKKTSYNTIFAENGQISKVMLPDGTVIWLNSGSSLKYSSEFGADNRNVELSGQAYFDVTKNKKLPFIVSCDKINVKVLGTEFSAEAYPESKIINVVLVEGSVDLVPQNTSKAFAHLKPNEMMEYNKQTNQFQIEEVLSQKYTSWKEGIVHIYDLPLKEVAAKLQKRYNQPIVVEKGLEDYKVTFSIRNEDFSDVLNMLQSIASAKAHQKGGIVYLEKR